MASTLELNVMQSVLLVRYGAVAEVGRFASALVGPEPRGRQVVVRTPHGLQLGAVLQQVSAPGVTSMVQAARQISGDHAAPVEDVEFNHDEPATGEETLPEIVRLATDDDAAHAKTLQVGAQQEFTTWAERICEWKLKLELIDLERTLDGDKMILYVLGDRGPDCTRLALHAAAAGLTGVVVQPVNADGLVGPQPSGGGCGSGAGGCGCH